jgi:hypothetical protein
MNGNLLIKNAQEQSLDAFVAILPKVIGCDRWEQRQSSNYVEERYFRRVVLGLEITVAVADDSGFKDYQFSLWLQPIGLGATETSFVDGLADCVARQFAVCGYDVLRPHDSRQGSGGIIYRLNQAEGAKPREKVVVEEI